MIPIFFTQYIERIVNFFKEKTVYEKHTMGRVIDSDDEILIKKNRNLLLDNQVSINKVRFVFQPIFTYDIDGDDINPVYDMMLPVHGNDGLLDKKSPVIEIGKPEHLMTIVVNNYKTPDNYQFLREELKRSKKGVVIYINHAYDVLDILGDDVEEEQSVDSDVIRFAVLDDFIETYNNNSTKL